MAPDGFGLVHWGLIVGWKKPHNRRKTSLIVGETRKQVLADSMAILLQAG